MESDLYRLPLVVSRSTVALAAAVVILAATGMAGLMADWTRRLDALSVLKARE
jgi:hypothetical protein